MTDSAPLVPAARSKTLFPRNLYRRKVEREYQNALNGFFRFGPQPLFSYLFKHFFGNPPINQKVTNIVRMRVFDIAQRGPL